MITPTTKLWEEVLEDTDDLIDYALSSSGDPTLHQWLLELKEKIAIIYGRTMKPVKQQVEERSSND